jgi:hypothetical protein
MLIISMTLLDPSKTRKKGTTVNTSMDEYADDGFENDDERNHR